MRARIPVVQRDWASSKEWWPIGTGILKCAVKKRTRFDRANYYARELEATLRRYAFTAFIVYFVGATIVLGHPPFTLSWLRP
jgi:hypothetical protein